ncbi:hypothetical protein AMTR_s00120p00025450 [Amborella trichopoda]|uniref:C2 domain-containing protein n=1 Tax=Amborella trichopoda TaxID=13333 RepID=W1NTR8_AMBTC|nr:hypothetical protein AMTR_s00120p00025450 [Amborella trichopoda]
MDTLKLCKTPPLFLCLLSSSSPRPFLCNHGFNFFLPPNPNPKRPSTVKLNSFDIHPKRRSSGSMSYRLFRAHAEASESSVSTLEKDGDSPSFDLNLAVVLAGFAFEAYTTPPENVGIRAVDPADCQTVFLSEQFLCEVYDGQLLIKLKKGFDFPAMDPWGTSDPYVVIQFDNQVEKSNIKWATKEPIWNEEFMINVKLPPSKLLQIAAWDANLVTPHKRMGNAGISIESFCDGSSHEMQVDLEGIGGGGKIQFEVKYKSFEELNAEKQKWKIPFISDFLKVNGLESASKMVLGAENMQARQFVESAFGQLRSFSGIDLGKNLFLEADSHDTQNSMKSTNVVGDENGDRNSPKELEPASSLDNTCIMGASGDTSVQGSSSMESNQSFEDFWKNYANSINQTMDNVILNRLSFPSFEKVRWDGIDVIKKIGLQSQRDADANYVESGLATPQIEEDKSSSDPSSIEVEFQSSIMDMRKASSEAMRQMDNILGALVVLTATFSQLKNNLKDDSHDDADGDASVSVKDNLPESSGMKDNLLEISETRKEEIVLGASGLDKSREEEMKALFSSAESAMEAWAMLATSLGRPSFIKSEFEKICFLDNPSTDTQVAIWRDPQRRRLVIAFRGTEQAKWKDLWTDLMLVPAGLNPERLGGDFKQEVQVHSGFLSAYDSVRNQILNLIKVSIGFVEDEFEMKSSWHVYITGHSLGGALATLLALELSSSQLAKYDAIRVTMYNFGSPRVGNKRFAEIYNEKVRDSWRIVNHRDIIPTVPRLMGYCHVAQPVYFRTDGLKDVLANMEIMGDGYQGDVIGESTPDVLVTEFMKGEKQLIEKILQTEINLFRSIRDGTALMQHMEDFYYITLLEGIHNLIVSIKHQLFCSMLGLLVAETECIDSKYS